MVDAGWLSVCGGTKILGREHEGQITGDFYFVFVLFGFCYYSRDWSKALRSQTEMPAVPLEASGIFPMMSVGFESAPECVFQMIGIFQVTPWFLPCTTRPACHLHTCVQYTGLGFFFALRNNMLPDTFPGGKWTPTYTQSYPANLYLVEFIILSMLLWTLCMGCSSNPKIVKNFFLSHIVFYLLWLWNKKSV